jgi:hypothetical protein
VARPILAKEVREQKNAARKANRLRSVKTVLEQGSCTDLEEIFGIIGKSLIAKDMMMSYDTFKRKTYSPELFSMVELERMAEIFDVDYDTIHSLILKHLKYNDRNKKNNQF